LAGWVSCWGLADIIDFGLSFILAVLQTPVLCLGMQWVPVRLIVSAWMPRWLLFLAASVVILACVAVFCSRLLLC
jgi:hypothetical protein